LEIQEKAILVKYKQKEKNPPTPRVKPRFIVKRCHSKPQQKADKKIIYKFSLTFLYCVQTMAAWGF